MLGGGNAGSIPQTLDQLLERQWEQGSQFLMEQAQHFDSKIKMLFFILFIILIILFQLPPFYLVCTNCVLRT